MAPQVDYFLDQEDIDDANKSGQFLFDIPGDANSRGNMKDLNDDKAKATWVQVLEVVESKAYDDVAKDKKGNEYPATCFEVNFQVPANAIRPSTGEPDPNAGRQTRAWYRLVPAAKGNKQHPKYKANNFTTAKLLGILRSIWGTDVVPHGTRPNLGEYFSGEEPLVVGKTVVAHVQQDKYEGKPQDQLTDFIPLEMQEK